MNTFILMLIVSGCYTVTSLSDKYAIAKAKFTGNEFTFLMCISMTVFMAFSLPLQELHFVCSWQAFAAICLVAVCKMLEFQMSALVLRQLSAFELKAWLGLTLFVSYLTDVFYGAKLQALKLICIVITILGLFFIAKSGKADKTDYRKIFFPLTLYLLSKYGYGLVIRMFSPYISPTMQLLPALLLLSAILLPGISLRTLLHKNPKGVRNVVLARIPNTVGMLLENCVIAVSLTSYSFIQPMILVVLFFIGLFRHEQSSKGKLFGSLLCIAGVLVFQFLSA